MILFHQGQREPRTGRRRQGAGALAQVKERAPELCIDGELQLDAAIIPEVAAKKSGSDNPLKGRQIFDFPQFIGGQRGLQGGAAVCPCQCLRVLSPGVMQNCERPLPRIKRG